MTPEERFAIKSNDYADLYIDYNRNPAILKLFPNAIIHSINDRYVITYTPANILTEDFVSKYGYSPLPRCYGLTSEMSLTASGVQRLRRIPGLNLLGKGVLVAIADTGIDYLNPIFIREDGTSKIIALWDQTIESDSQYPPKTFYGTEYSREQINLALKSDNPYSIVPSTDDIGHGTMLAGILVGSEVPDKNFAGVVPEADILVIKLKQAKQNLRDFYIIPPEVPCYQENDIQRAYQYIYESTNRYSQPCSICFGLGTSQGSHDGRGSFSNQLSYSSYYIGTVASVAAGNEGDNNRHFYSTIDPSVGTSNVELVVGENEPGFTMELWGTLPNTYSIDITSPTGEYVSQIQESLRTNRVVSFIFEITTITITYSLVETHSGEQLILMRFKNPTQGVWKFTVYSRGDLTGSFHIWLPMNGFISNNTYFIQPDRYTTVTSPGDAQNSITVTAYNPQTNSLYDKASRGYLRTNVIKPELAAPGVNVIVPTLEKGFTTASGTGLAAAHTAGIAAIMLQWGIVSGQYPNMNSTVIKKYLIRGAKRSNTLKYPNKDWGYGMVDLYNVFNVLRSDFPTIPGI